MKNLSLCAMNVGQAGIAKIPQIHDKVRDFDVLRVCKSLISTWPASWDLYRPSASWVTTCFWGQLLMLDMCVLQLSPSFPSGKFDWGVLTWSDRSIAAVLGCQQPIIIACSYGHASCAPQARQHVCEQVDVLNWFGKPLVLMGDDNLEVPDLADIWSIGVASCMDDAFLDHELPPTCTGRRRIDFGLSSRLFPDNVFFDEGVANHALVGYSILVDATSLFYAPRRTAVDNCEPISCALESEFV